MAFDKHAADGHAPGFVPGRGYTQEDWNEVCDNPEVTPEQAAASRPLAEIMPELVAAMKRGRRGRGGGRRLKMMHDTAVVLRSGTTVRSNHIEGLDQAWRHMTTMAPVTACALRSSTRRGERSSHDEASAVDVTKFVDSFIVLVMF